MTRTTEMLRVVHAHPGVTRADAARHLGIGTGAATELVARLTQASLLAEAPAARSGTRGRPTTALVAHPSGPLVLAAQITHRAWRLDTVELGGRAIATVSAGHKGTAWSDVVTGVTSGINRMRETYGERVRALGIAAPGPVTSDRRLDATTSGWHDVDLHDLWPDAPLLVAGNDASLAATAESARGAATGAAVALHLLIEYGLGGAVVDQGRLVIGAHGASGEFGHMPFGDPAVICPCGARGCWGTAVDGTALARHLGQPAPADPVSYAKAVIASPAPAERAAVAMAAAALGRGIAGLVNGLDADLVILSSIAADLLAAAPAELHSAYQSGLMAIRRSSPPSLLPAALGPDGPIAGAAEAAWSSLLGQLAQR